MLNFIDKSLNYLFLLQLQQLKLGGAPTIVPAVEEKPKENGQVETGDQVSNATTNKVISAISNVACKKRFGICHKIAPHNFSARCFLYFFKETNVFCGAATRT